METGRGSRELTRATDAGYGPLFEFALARLLEGVSVTPAGRGRKLVGRDHEVGFPEYRDSSNAATGVS